MDRVVQSRTDMHIRNPRRVTVTSVGGNVIDGQRSLMRCQCPSAGRRILGNLTPVVCRVSVECPYRIDRGELIESQSAFVHGINPLCDASKQPGEQRGYLVE